MLALRNIMQDHIISEFLLLTGLKLSDNSVKSRPTQSIIYTSILFEIRYDFYPRIGIYNRH